MIVDKPGTECQRHVLNTRKRERRGEPSSSDDRLIGTATDLRHSRTIRVHLCVKVLDRHFVLCQTRRPFSGPLPLRRNSFGLCDDLCRCRWGFLRPLLRSFRSTKPAQIHGQCERYSSVRSSKGRGFSLEGPFCRCDVHPLQQGHRLR